MTDNSIKISVIVPVYNVHDYLARCVDSILEQTYSNLEIILVDDGSTDDSGAMCEAYQKKDNRILVLHKENGGLMSAWMAGVAISTGAYLTFVDSDDWIDSQMISEMTDRLKEQTGEIICCNYVIDGFGTPVARYHGLEPGEFEGEKLEAQVKRQLLGHENRRISFSRCMKLVSRELIEQNLHYCDTRLKMGEDVNIMLPALLDSSRVVILPEAAYYHYFYNQSSIVHKYDVGLYENLKLLNEAIKTIVQDKKEYLSQTECRKEYIFLLMLALKNEARGNETTGTKMIRQICGDENTPKLMKENPVEIKERANQLLAFVMRHPNSISIAMLKWSMKWYYRKQ